MADANTNIRYLARKVYLEHRTAIEFADGVQAGLPGGDAANVPGGDHRAQRLAADPGKATTICASDRLHGIDLRLRRPVPDGYRTRMRCSCSYFASHRTPLCREVRRWLLHRAPMPRSGRSCSKERSVIRKYSLPESPAYRRVLRICRGTGGTSWRRAIWTTGTTLWCVPRSRI